jgi:pseudouridine-5'-phosphate glycosidase
MNDTDHTFSQERANERRRGGAVVALESALITHGLPKPLNFLAAREMEEQVRRAGAKPVILAILNGRVKIGLTETELKDLSEAKDPHKISDRDIAFSLLKKYTGGTTVAGTLVLAAQAGIHVMATGGIGGVHRGQSFDISSDLRVLSQNPLIVVCSGAKSILDVSATLEVLETLGVPVVGYRTEQFPGFYSVESGSAVTTRLDDPAEIASFAKIHWSTGARSAILVANPIVEADAVDNAKIEPVIQEAVQRAEKDHILGQSLTPYLLGRLAEAAGEEILRANLSLLKTNAHLAGEIALAFESISTLKSV